MRNIVVFILALLTCVSVSCGTVSAQGKSVVELKTVVIDAGHGGHDPGATNGKIYEKNITLSVAMMVGDLIKKNHPGVKVIYTRDDDTFVNLYKRADIANKSNADLFISIHVNSAADRSARGHETFVMGSDMNKSNFEVCQLENSVIVLEDDYSSNYQGFDPNNPESYIIFTLLQNAHLEQSLDFATLIQKNASAGPVANNRGVKQGNFIVLWKCTMPAVLIELGFLSNSNDMKILTSKTYQQQIAGNIYNAFKAYKKQYDTEILIPEQVTAEHGGKDVSGAEERAVESTSAQTGEYGFGIQILASRNLLYPSSKEFKGWSAKSFKEGNVYKYYIGNYKTREEARNALPKVKESFPEAFVVKIKK